MWKFDVKNSQESYGRTELEQQTGGQKQSWETQKELEEERPSRDNMNIVVCVKFSKKKKSKANNLPPLFPRYLYLIPLYSKSSRFSL